MLKVNKTFEDLQILQELNEAWKEVGPRIKNYMESSVEIQLLQVRRNSLHHYKRDEGDLKYFDTVSQIFFLCPFCVLELVKEARGGSSGQPPSGKHILDSLADRSFPVFTLTRCCTYARRLIHVARHL